MKELEMLIQSLPEGSYESGWSQCFIFPIGKSSKTYANGNRFAVQQKNWRTKDERFVYAETLDGAITKFLNLPSLDIPETSKSATLIY